MLNGLRERLSICFTFVQADESDKGARYILSVWLDEFEMRHIFPFDMVFRALVKHGITFKSKRDYDATYYTQGMMRIARREF